jgi:hypothetical protein
MNEKTWLLPTCDHPTTIDDNGKNSGCKGQRICVNSVVTHTAITGGKITNAR